MSSPKSHNSLIPIRIEIAVSFAQLGTIEIGNKLTKMRAEIKAQTKVIRVLSSEGLPSSNTLPNQQHR